MRSLLAAAAAPASLWALLLGAPAGAESAAAPHWDDRHMQSNFANRPGTTPPIVVVGSNRFEATEPAPATGVQEQILAINPHGWEPGGARGGTRTGGPGWGPSSAEFSSSDGARAQRGAGVSSGRRRTAR